MKRHSNRGFTLIEMLTVMVVIAILAALILNIHSFVNAKASSSRAQGEIQAMSAACESYKADNGSYPRLATTTEGTLSSSVPATQSAPPISPMTNFDPVQADAKVYQAASLFLYEQLSGDLNADGLHQTNEPAPYMNFRPDQIGKLTPTATQISYLQDPYGNSYGYSTAAAADEDAYQQAIQTNPAATRVTTHGFNSTFDLWSTGGKNAKPASSSTADQNAVWGRWIKNW
jgi:prepilin-type N-terminal cleavage/methylation domain-containing protein